MAQVFVAAGSNLEPALRLVQAARLLRQRFADIRFAGCYRNRAQDFDGPDFINTVASFATDLPLTVLRAELRQVEALCGRSRERGQRAACALDLDVLLYNQLVLDTADGRLPRPELLQRAYLLGPLAELAPGLRHPLAGRSIAELWQSLPQTGHALERIALDLNAA